MAALALMALLATPALAGKPLVQTMEESGSYTISCETVTLVDEYEMSFAVKMWLDANGDMTRGHARVRFDGTITAEGSTLRLTEQSRYTSFIDFGPDGPTVREIGLQYKFSAPGLGVVAHDVGVLTTHPDGTFEVKGPHDVHESGESGVESLICPFFE